MMGICHRNAECQTLFADYATCGSEIANFLGARRLVKPKPTFPFMTEPVPCIAFYIMAARRFFSQITLASLSVSLLVGMCKCS